ncbi:MAG: hypothetical protein ACK52I_26330 [Pseudomonadota bacterium]|jgi:hypothetical protein
MTTSDDMKNVPLEIRRMGPEAVAMYEKLSSQYGEKWAAMCVTQTPPGTRGTDRALMEGRYAGQWLDEMHKDHANKIVREAKAAGINISGKFYCSGLADKRGHCDPAAWIESTGDIKRVAEERNLTVHGIVNHKGRPEPPKRVKLNEKIVKRLVAEERKRHPGKKAGELREMVIEKHAPKWKEK